MSFAFGALLTFLGVCSILVPIFIDKRREKLLEYEDFSLIDQIVHSKGIEIIRGFTLNKEICLLSLVIVLAYSGFAPFFGNSSMLVQSRFGFDAVDAG